MRSPAISLTVLVVVALVALTPVRGPAAEPEDAAGEPAGESRATLPAPKVTRIDPSCSGAERTVVVEFESMPGYALFRDGDEIVLSLPRAQWAIPQSAQWHGCEPVAGYRVRREPGRPGGQLRIVAPGLRVAERSRVAAREPGGVAVRLRLADAAGEEAVSEAETTVPARRTSAAAAPRPSATRKMAPESGAAPAREAGPRSAVVERAVVAAPERPPHESAARRAPAPASRERKAPEVTAGQAAAAGATTGSGAVRERATRPETEPALTEVRQVRIGEHAGMTRLVVDLTGPIVFDSSTDGPALVVDLRRVRWSAADRGTWRRGRVREYRYRDGRLRIEGAAALAWRRSFLLPPDGPRGHRLVLDVVDR